MGESYKAKYIEATEAFNRFDSQAARSAYEVSKQFKETRFPSIQKLIKIDLREGKFASARELLEKEKAGLEYNYYLLKGLLENVENNFNQSFINYNECLKAPFLQIGALNGIAKFHIQNANYDIAEMMYKTLLQYKHYFAQVVMELIIVNILKGEYDEASKYLRKINYSRLEPKHKSHYIIVQAFIDNVYNKRSGKINDYVVRRIFEDNDEEAIEHIKKHLNQTDRYSTGCFLEDVDIRRLYEEVQSKIQSMNANHFEITDMYRFRLDNPIGYKGDEMTRDICVSTLLGTKKIVTMCPVQLSSKFDEEGFSTSEELRIKRNSRGR